MTKKYKQRLVPYEEKLADNIYRYCVAMGILTVSEAYLFPTIDKDIPLTQIQCDYFADILTRFEALQTNQLSLAPVRACIAPVCDSKSEVEVVTHNGRFEPCWENVKGMIS